MVVRFGTCPLFGRSLTTMRLAVCLVALIGLNRSTFGDDWPRWNGPMANGTYSETGTVESIPAGGLRKLWSASVGLGYSGPAVSNGRVFVSDYVKASGDPTNNPGGRDRLTGVERLQCFDASSGKFLWENKYEREYNISYPAGPRATPTVDGDLVYVLGAEGDLHCCSTSDGKVVWKRQLKEDYKTESPIWGYSAAPVVHNDLLYVLAGGEGSLAVAFNKRTGEEVWRALSNSKGIGYCPPSIVEVAGSKQLLVWDPSNVYGLVPETGRTIWSYPIAPKYEMSIIPPVVNGNKLYISGIGETAAMVQLKADGTGVDELWKGGSPKEAVYAANGAPIFDGDYLYGSDCGSGKLICVRATDGQRMWETFQPTAGGERRASHGTAFLTKVGKLYYVFSETGDFIIAKLSPEQYEEIGRFHAVDATNEAFGRPVVWSYPAYAEKSLFVRNDKEIVAYSLAK